MRFPLRLLLFISLSVGATAAAPHFDSDKRWLTIAMADTASQASLIAFGDVNGDGKADLILYDPRAGTAYVALSTGSSFRTEELFAMGLPTGTDLNITMVAADVNGDRRADLVIFKHGADNVPGATTAVVALSTGTHFQYSSNQVWNPSWCASYQVCLPGDINGDGRSDLVAFTPNFGTVWGTLSTGNAFGANSVWNNYFCINGEVCALGDVDGDGKADAILFKPHATGNQKGNVLWARSTGSAFTNVQYGHGYFCIDAERCLVGDVNGDHRADIVLLKGFGTTSPSLDVLVALSDGSHFINATPFSWGQVPYGDAFDKTYGTFALADVTGDGRADLVEWVSVTVPNPGGGLRVTGHAVEVFAATDQASAPNGNTPPPPPPPSPAPNGYSSVAVYNCQPDQDRLYLWNFDTTANTNSQTGLVDAMYSESGLCPDPDDTPQTFPLVNGHIHTIAAVDPSAIGCDGRNDLSILGCQTGSLSVRGASNGPVCRWIVSAQQPSCVVTQSTMSKTINPSRLHVLLHRVR